MNSKKLAVSLFCVILFISLMADTEGFVDWPTEDHRKPKTVAKISCFFAPVLPSFVRMSLTVVPFPLRFCFLCFHYFIRSGCAILCFSFLPFFFKSFFTFLPFFLSSFSSFSCLFPASFIPIRHCFHSCSLSCFLSLVQLLCPPLRLS